MSSFDPEASASRGPCDLNLTNRLIGGNNKPRPQRNRHGFQAPGGGGSLGLPLVAQVPKFDTSHCHPGSANPQTLLSLDDAPRAGPGSSVWPCGPRVGLRKMSRAIIGATPDQVPIDEIVDGLRTAKNSGGEIRGQVLKAK